MSFWTFGWKKTLEDEKKCSFIEIGKERRTRIEKNLGMTVRYSICYLQNAAGDKWHFMSLLALCITHIPWRASFSLCLSIMYIAFVRVTKSKLSCLLEIFSIRNSLNNVMFSILSPYILFSLLDAVCIRWRIIHSLCAFRPKTFQNELTQPKRKIYFTISKFILCAWKI